MIQYLPFAGFKWLLQRKVDRINRECPEELHNLDNDYTLAPEKLRLNKICYQIIAKKLQISIILRLMVSKNLFQI